MTGAPILRIVASIAVLTAGVGAVQQRDRLVTPVASEVGTATVDGRVTESLTSETAVRRAVVTLASDTGVTYSAVADDAGRFVLAGVAAGRYTLVARKGGYLATSYGAKRPGRTGTTIILGEGQRISDLRLALPRGGVITGAVRLPNGEPLPNTLVVVIPASDVAAGGRLGGTRFTTDDRGVYRIYGLSPGDYVVGVMPMVGREVQQRSAAEYEDEVRRLTAQQGRPGTVRVEDPSPSVPTVGYAPTYFPGTTIAAQATPIRLEAGAVREGVDVPVDLVRMSRITGVVRGLDGRPLRAVQVSAEAIGPPLPLTAALSPRVSSLDDEGRFVISNVAPGTYRVTARSGGVTLSPGGGVTIRSADQTNWAVADVLALGDDVEGVVLQLQPGLTFSGAMTTVGDAGAPTTWKGASISIRPTRAGTAGAEQRTAAVADDGSFEVVGIQPDTYEVSVTLPSAISKTWSLRSVLAGDRDVRDAPLTFGAGSVRGVSVVLTDAGTTLTGTLSSASGQAATDYYIVIFPADRAMWHAHSPRIRATRPDGAGQFTVRDLPDGTYRIAALTDVEDNEWRQIPFLESLYEVSLTATVTAGQTTRQDLRIR